MNELEMKLNKSMVIVFILFGFGIMLRFFVMSLGVNYDFESYMVVGEIVSQGKNVYAETSRYNYAFLFSWIQGIAYCFSQIRYLSFDYTYRITMVSILTIADLGIAMWIGKRYSLKLALLFFLNPISIIITGYHNQFDNIAVFFALMSISFYDDGEELSRRDWISILFLSLSLFTKHILFMFFAWILFRNLHSGKKQWIKKLCYACIPPFVFLLSFVPYAIQDQRAAEGILKNVFLYRSYNNFPLFAPIMNLIHLDVLTFSYNFLIYMGILFGIGILASKLPYEKSLLLYLMVMVAFASAVANQYLIIPIVGLLVLDGTWVTVLYMVIGFIYCLFNATEIGWIDKFQEVLPHPFNEWLINFSSEGGIAISILMILLCFACMRKIYRENKLMK